MEHATINDLPNELLEMIFDHLDVDELKDASIVCKRWSDLAFSGRRMQRVKLVPDFPLVKDLLQSNRKYRHLVLKNTTEVFAYVKNLFQMFSVTSLRIKSLNLTFSSLRLILLEVPNLQHLLVEQKPKQMNESFEPFPVMRNLKYLEIDYSPHCNSGLPWHTIAPSLQGLRMFFGSEEQFEQCIHFSGQLKQVYFTFNRQISLNRFYEMTFPLLEELSISSLLDVTMVEYGFRDFFRRNTSLRRLRLDGFDLSKTLVEDITHYSKKMTSLQITGLALPTFNGQPGSLESLSQLPELKHLRLENLDTSIFRGSEALTSLQSLSMSFIWFDHKDKLGFFEDLFQIAPQLRCLQLRSAVMPAWVVQYICNHFTNLTRFRLKYSEKVTRDGLSGIDRLPHLLYLELKLIEQNISFSSAIPQNKVRYLTLHLPFACDYDYDGDDLLQLPEIFPHLIRLNLINSREVLHESTVDKLCQLLPSCAVIIYGPFITNVWTKRRFRKWTGSEMMLVWEKEWTWDH